MREIVVEALRMWMADQGIPLGEGELETQAAAALAAEVFAEDWEDPLGLTTARSASCPPHVAARRPINNMGRGRIGVEISGRQLPWRSASR